MILPTWATPLDFARTHPIHLCDCEKHYPAVMEVKATWLQRIPKRLTNKEYHYRYVKRRGGQTQEEYEERREWDVIEHTFTYYLCPVCYIWELEIQGVIPYLTSETLSKAYQAAFERAGYSCTDRKAQTINGLAQRAYNTKKKQEPNPKTKQPAAAKQKETAAA